MKKFLLCITTLFILPVLCIPAFAHPGKTDADGGHYDQETGEYHYHHGYPAHDHYDMDGNGYVDCPYDFDDQTGCYSGSSSSSVGGTSYRQPISVKKETPPPSTVPTTSKSSRSPGTKSPSVPLKPVWVVVAILLLSLYITIKWKNYRILSIERRSQENTDKVNKALSEAEANNEQILQVLESSEKQCSLVKNDCSRLQVRNNELAEEVLHLKKKCRDLEFQNNTLQQKVEVFFNKEISFREQLGVPENVYFINKNIPVCGDISMHRPFGDYTFYVSAKGRCFHTDYYCSSALMYPVHKYDIIRKLLPCKKCCPLCNDLVPEWYYALQKHDINLVEYQTNEYYEELMRYYEDRIN